MKASVIVGLMVVLAAGCGGGGEKSCDKFCQELVDCGAKDSTDLALCKTDCAAWEGLMQPAFTDLKDCASGDQCPAYDTCTAGKLAGCTPPAQTASVVEAFCTKLVEAGSVMTLEACKADTYYNLIIGCYQAGKLPALQSCFTALTCEAGTGMNDCFGFYVVF